MKKYVVKFGDEYVSGFGRYFIRFCNTIGEAKRYSYKEAAERTKNCINYEIIEINA